MSDDVRDTIRAKLRAGILPRDAPARVWYGQGADYPCAACGRRIGRADRECEADFAGGTTLRLHRDCYYLWDDERNTARDDPRQPDETSAITAAILAVALCVPCIVEKTGIPVSGVRGFFARITATVEVTEASGLCPECERVTTTYRIG